MTVDTRARHAATALHEDVQSIDVPAPATVVRRAHRRRVGTAATAIVLVAAVAGGAALLARDDPPGRVELAGRPDAAVPSGTRTVGNWTVVPKEPAGLGEGTSFDTIATTDDAILLGGAGMDGDEWAAAIWRSDDGLTWELAESPRQRGQVMAVAVDGDDALALGTDGTGNGATSFTWSSDDGGRTWTDLRIDVTTLGPAAHEMGRPFATQLLYDDGWWVAAGGASDGYAAVWVSRDGATWEQTLASRDGGSLMIVRGDDGRLHAYGSSTVHHADDPTNWSDAVRLSMPPQAYLTSVAPDAPLAVAWSHVRHLEPTPLLQSSASGATWTEVPSFLATAPDAWAWTVRQFGDLTVVAGAVDPPTRTQAWVSRDLVQWETIPEELLYTATETRPRTLDGGTLSLVASVGDRIVLLGTAPELDRFYTYEP